MQFRNKPIGLSLFSAVLSLFNLVAFNIPLIRYAFANSGSIWVTVSITLLVFTLNFFACYLVCSLLRIVGRVLVAVCNLLSAVCVYFIVNYKVIIDETMIGNVFNTNASEASGFINLTIVAVFLAVGVLPAVFILLRKVEYPRFKKAAAWIAGSLLISGAVVGVNMDSVLWIGKHDTELGGLIMPWSYTVNSVRYLNHKRLANRPETLLPDATFADSSRTAVVLVIGESARRENFSLYGYSRDTNPLLSAVEGLHVYECNACATYTTAGIRHILEHESSRTLYEILPNYLCRTGADVEWRTTNWGEPPLHVGSRLKRADLERGDPGDRYDAVLLNGLKERIESSGKSKVFIVLHTSTSHGPAYCERYPAEFGVFSPVCDNVEEASKNPQELVNAYDNTILYTDWLLNGTIGILKGIEGMKTTMFYISDHGESLGENGLFMHGMPLSMAPPQQYEIPCLVWTGDSTRTAKAVSVVDQSYVFHTVLGFFGCKSPVYKPEKDLFE